MAAQVPPIERVAAYLARNGDAGAIEDGRVALVATASGGAVVHTWDSTVPRPADISALPLPTARETTDRSEYLIVRRASSRVADPKTLSRIIHGLVRQNNPGLNRAQLRALVLAWAVDPQNDVDLA